LFQYTIKSRERPSRFEFHHFGKDSRTRENPNHSNRISISTTREDISKEIL